MIARRSGARAGIGQAHKWQCPHADRCTDTEYNESVEPSSTMAVTLGIQDARARCTYLCGVVINRLPNYLRVAA